MAAPTTPTATLQTPPMPNLVTAALGLAVPVDEAEVEALLVLEAAALVTLEPEPVAVDAPLVEMGMLAEGWPEKS